jgi:Mrp family chromosome partitioning ATPase
MGRALVARWRVAVAVWLAVMAGVLAYVGSLPDVYSARAVLTFTPRLGAGLGAPELRAILPAYVVYITAPSTMSGLAGSVGETADDLASAVHASLMADSSTMAIEVTLDEAEQAAKVANLLAGEVLSFAEGDALLLTRVIAPAVADRDPSGPARALFGAAGFIVATLLGAAAAVGLERARPRVRTSTEVGEATGHAVLARIPARRGGGIDIDDPALAAAMRGVRAAITRAGSPEVVAVTSSLPGEGKTTAAAALATTVARHGASVLLVDADLRHRGLSRRYGFRPGTEAGQRPGLETILRGDATLDDCLRPGPIAGLAILPTAVDAEAANLLSLRLPEFLAEHRSRYQHIIIDAPPLLVGGDDAEAIITSSDASVLVVARDTPAYVAHEAADTLRNLDVTVLGAIANGARQPAFPLAGPVPATTAE